MEKNGAVENISENAELKALETEARKGVEEPAEEEVKEPIEGAEPEPEKKVEENPEDTLTAEPQKTPITDDDRKRIKGIPDKFKNWEDFLKWGSEAEKNMGKALTEKDQLSKQKEQYEILAESLKKELATKVEKGQTTPEEQEQQMAELKDRFFEDPIGYINNIIKAKDKEAADIKSQEEKIRTWDEENKSYETKYGAEKWNDEIRPELLKISHDRPYLSSLKEVVAIYLMNESDKVEKTQVDKDKKLTDKKKAFVETGGGSPAASKSVIDEIAGATSIADLEKMKDRIK